MNEIPEDDKINPIDAFYLNCSKDLQKVLRKNALKLFSKYSSLIELLNCLNIEDYKPDTTLQSSDDVKFVEKEAARIHGIIIRILLHHCESAELFAVDNAIYILLSGLKNHLANMPEYVKEALREGE
jgi:hypothetical protein